MTPGGTHGHMHTVLDGLPPHAAIAAVAAEFPAWHLHESAAGGLWADTNWPGPGRIDVRAPGAYTMWQLLAEREYRKYLATRPLHGHPAVTP